MNHALRAFALGAPILALVAGMGPGGTQRRAGPVPIPAFMFMAYDSSGPSDLLAADADGSDVRLLLASADAQLTPAARRRNGPSATVIHKRSVALTDFHHASFGLQSRGRGVLG